MTVKTNHAEDAATGVATPKQHSRRDFLVKAGGFSLLSAAVISSCKKDEFNSGDFGAVNLGSGDVGILNYAYALEQLEAAFYTAVLNEPYVGITIAESGYLKDIRDHEIAHREFFKAALGSNAIASLRVNFSQIDFTTRSSVLATAKAFEDLGVTAYNGAGQLLQSAAYLTLAGKIVSVEARHAALIRDLINQGSFADNTAVDANAMDMARLPKDVLAIAGPYILTKIDASSLPS